MNSNLVFLNPVLLNVTQYTVNVFGAGGTGSHLIDKLAAIAHALRETTGKTIRLTAYDFDTVSERNVGRSDFINGDTGIQKTSIAVSKVNLGYGLNWRTDFPANIRPAHFTFLCTDSTKSRLEIKEATIAFKSKEPDERPYYIFDIGNDKDFGQVVMTNLDGELRDIDRSGLTSETIGTETCGERPLFAEQGLFINQFLAVIAAEMFWSFLTQFNLDYNQVFANLSMMKINSKLEWNEKEN